MNVFGHRLSIGRTIASAVALVMVGCALMLGSVAYLGRDFDDPALYVLGAGDNLSLLITDGSARLLIANGNDAAALGNALRRAQPFAHDRIDLLLLIGSGADVTFLSRSLTASDARHVELIGDESITAALRLPASSHIRSSRRFWLSDQTSVTVEVSPKESIPAWRIVVTHRQTRLAFISDSEATATFAPNGIVTAFLMNDSDALTSVPELQPLVIVAADDVARDDLLAAGSSSFTGPIWTYRVFDGDVLKIGLDGNKLILPGNGVKASNPHSPTAASATRE